MKCAIAVLSFILVGYIPPSDSEPPSSTLEVKIFDENPASSAEAKFS